MSANETTSAKLEVRCPCCGTNVHENPVTKRNHRNWLIKCLVMFGIAAILLSLAIIFHFSDRLSGAYNFYFGLGLGIIISVNISAIPFFIRRVAKHQT